MKDPRVPSISAEGRRAQPRWPRADAVIAFAIALVAIVVYQQAWPPAAGRDLDTYVQYYVDITSAAPTFPMLMLYRTPGAPLFFGLVTELGGATSLAWALRLLYAATVASTLLIGAAWNRQTGWIAAGALLVYPGFAAFFHEVGSDVLFCAAFTAWAAVACWTAERPTAAQYAAHGAAVFLLILVRPVAQVCLVFPFALLFVRAVPWRRRVASAVAFCATVGVLLSAWAGYNRIRYGDFTVVRGNGGITPFYRVYAIDRLVSETNGLASRTLADAMRRDLLNHEPYASRGIDVATVFAAGNDRMWSDLFALSDRAWGWHSDYAVLRAVAWEAIRAHPMTYVGNVVHDALATVGLNEYAPPAPGSAPRPGPLNPDAPTKGQMIPFSYVWWLASTPDGSHPPLHVLVDGPRQKHIADIVGSRAGSVRLAKALNGLGRMYPPMIVWIIAGAVGWMFSRERMLVPLVLLALSALVIVASAAGQGIVYQYRFPFDPLFIAFGVHGFVREGLRRNSARGGVVQSEAPMSNVTGSPA